MKIVTKVADKDQANVLLELAGRQLRSNIREPHYVCFNNGVFSVTRVVSQDDKKVSKQFFLFAIETGKLMPDFNDDVECSMDGGTSWATPTDPTFYTQSAYNMLVRSARVQHVLTFNEGDVVVNRKGDVSTIVTPTPDAAGLLVVECDGEYLLQEFNTLKPYVPKPTPAQRAADYITDMTDDLSLVEALQWLVDEGKITINE